MKEAYLLRSHGHYHGAPPVCRDYVSLCVGVREWIDVGALVFSLPGFVTPHLFKFPYAICVEGSLKGRHPNEFHVPYFENGCDASSSRVKVRLDYIRT